MKFLAGHSMILHVDMDAFYASVEERENPELLGKPVVVGGRPDGRGVVCAANYVARQYGIHSAMPARQAVRLCPQAIFLASRLDFYAEISQQIRDIFFRFTPLVEPLSLDEAFLDVTPSEQLFGPAEDIGQSIKRAIRDELRLVASVGVAPNKFLAKIASDLGKPNGFTVVPNHGVREFLDPLPVERLWGVGKVASQRLARLRVRTIGQLRKHPREALVAQFGQHGDHLWQLAQGQDDRAVVPDREAKSISHETTFARDIEDREILEAWLMELTEQVSRRLRRHERFARTVHIKLRSRDFRTITRASKLEAPTASTDALWRVALELLRTRVPADAFPLRLLGMGVSDLGRDATRQLTLFEEPGPQSKQTVFPELDEATDRIRERFGTQAVRRGNTLAKPDERPDAAS